MAGVAEHRLEPLIIVVAVAVAVSMAVAVIALMVVLRHDPIIADRTGGWPKARRDYRRSPPAPLRPTSRSS